MDVFDLLIPIFAISLLSVGWIGVQFLAQKMGTKNHFDNKISGCGHCSCGSICEVEGEH